MLAAAVVVAGADDAQRKALLASMVDGSAPTAVALPGSGALEGTRAGDGTLRVTGEVGPVLGAMLATRLLVPVSVHGRGRGRPRRGVVRPRPRRRRGHRRPSGQPRPDPTGGHGAHRRARSWSPSASSRRCRVPWCGTWRSCSPPPSAPEGRAGVSTWERPTPSNAASSGVPSASSRPSSTVWPTCWCRWSRSPPWPGTPPRPPTPATPPRRACRPSWRGPSPSTPTSSAPRAASRSSGAWASPGSTTPTCTCAGR